MKLYNEVWATCEPWHNFGGNRLGWKFIEEIERLASDNGKDPRLIYKLWREYCRFSSFVHKSPALREFEFNYRERFKALPDFTPTNDAQAPMKIFKTFIVEIHVTKIYAVSVQAVNKRDAIAQAEAQDLNGEPSSQQQRTISISEGSPEPR